MNLSAHLHGSQQRDLEGGFYVTPVIHAGTPSQDRITSRCKYWILLSLIYVHKISEDPRATPMNEANGTILLFSVEKPIEIQSTSRFAANFSELPELTTFAR